MTAKLDRCLMALFTATEWRGSDRRAHGRSAAARVLVVGACSGVDVVGSGDVATRLRQRQCGHVRLLPRSIQARTFLGTV